MDQLDELNRRARERLEAQGIYLENNGRVIELPKLTVIRSSRDA
jgi:hypothetical protein